MVLNDMASDRNQMLPLFLFMDARNALILKSMREKGISPDSDEGRRLLNMGAPLDRLSRAKQSKDKGNAAFKDRDYGQAMLFYSQSIKAMGGDLDGVGRRAWPE